MTDTGSTIDDIPDTVITIANPIIFYAPGLLPIEPDDINYDALTTTYTLTYKHQVLDQATQNNICNLLVPGYSNRANMIAQAQQALMDNGTFLALTAPTNAQVLNQVQALTRQVNALIRLVIKAYN